MAWLTEDTTSLEKLEFVTANHLQSPDQSDFPRSITTFVLLSDKFVVFLMSLTGSVKLQRGNCFLQRFEVNFNIPAESFALLKASFHAAELWDSLLTDLQTYT